VDKTSLLFAAEAAVHMQNKTNLRNFYLHYICFMKLIRTGSSRYVITTKNFAFKFPALYSYRAFLKGLLANLQEKEFSRIQEMKHKLCPVLFSLPAGLLIVMPKARILSENELPASFLEDFCKCNENYSVPAEMKFDSFGYLPAEPDPILVAVDYGN